ncbi:MAG: DUF192 domain-containing protein [Alphaproteobacteria bacterium]|nr:DUF192 domain-containing protein [Alphaproteobacteria bacterium]
MIHKSIIFLLSFQLILSFPLLAKNLTLSCPHKDIPLTVEIAQTPQDHANGLMFRKHLEEDAGMLFLFLKPKTAAMWMKNTPLSLDIMFCNWSGQILAIYENTTPFSLETIGPVKGTAQVLEINGGTVQKQGISRACRLKLDP